MVDDDLQNFIQLNKYNERETLVTLDTKEDLKNKACKITDKVIYIYNSISYFLFYKTD